MDRDCAAGIVHLQVEFRDFDHVGDEYSGDEADVDRRDGRDEGAGRAARDQAGDPAVGAMDASGLR